MAKLKNPNAPKLPVYKLQTKGGTKLKVGRILLRLDSVANTQTALRILLEAALKDHPEVRLARGSVVLYS